MHFRADTSGMLTVEGADCQLEKTVLDGEKKVVPVEEAEGLDGWEVVKMAEGEGTGVGEGMVTV